MSRPCIEHLNLVFDERQSKRLTYTCTGEWNWPLNVYNPRWRTYALEFRAGISPWIMAVVATANGGDPGKVLVCCACISRSSSVDRAVSLLMWAEFKLISENSGIQQISGRKCSIDGLERTNYFFKLRQRHWGIEWNSAPWLQRLGHLYKGTHLRVWASKTPLFAASSCWIFLHFPPLYLVSYLYALSKTLHRYGQQIVDDSRWAQVPGS